MFLKMFCYVLLCPILTGAIIANDLTLRDADNLFQAVNWQLKKEVAEYDIRMDNDAVRLDQGAARQEGFVRVDHYRLDTKNDYNSKALISPDTLKTIYEQQHLRNVTNGVLFGALLAVIIYNLYIYFIIKDQTCLYYSGYLFFCVVFLLMWNDYFSQWLPSWQLKLLTIFSCLAITFSILFTNGYLRVAKYAPGIYRFYKWLIIASLVPIGVDWGGYPSLAFQLLYALSVAGFAYGLIAAYFSFRHGWKPAAYFLVALGFLLTGYIFYELFQSSMSLQIGICLQALTLTFVQAINLSDLKKETSLLQNTMIAQTTGFSKTLIMEQEKEKSSIAGEINKTVGQQLVLLKNEMFALKKRHPDNQSELLDVITKDIGKVIEEVSTVSFSLRPYQLETLGLKSSIERLAEETSDAGALKIALDMDETALMLNREMEINIYRIVQELLNNLIKHAMASNCRICIKKNKKGDLRIYYHDNGVGFDNNNTPKGLGLLSISERCILMNATSNLVSMRDAGTKLLIKIPASSTTGTSTIE